MTTPNVDEHMEPLELSDIAGRGKNDRTIWKTSFSLKTEHIPTLWPSNFFHSYLPKRKKEAFFHEDLHNVHNRFIHNTLKTGNKLNVHQNENE